MNKDEIIILIERDLYLKLPDERFQIAKELLHEGAVENVGEVYFQEKKKFKSLLSFRTQGREDIPKNFIRTANRIIGGITTEEGDVGLVNFNIGNKLFKLIFDADNNRPLGILDHTMLTSTKSWIARQKGKRG